MTNVGVIGLGYVGLPLVLALIRAGKKVVGYDSNAEVVLRLNDGGAHLPLWDVRFRKEVVPGDNAIFTDNPQAMNGLDSVIICVPTPLGLDGSPDHSCVQQAFKAILSLSTIPNLVILESTVAPGFTRYISNEVFGERLVANSGTVHVCFSPEREDPGNEEFTNVEIPKVISGLTPACLIKGTDLYVQIFQHVVRASSLETAELCKLHENTFRAVNIAYANQFRDLAASLDLNFEEVLNLAKSKPFGFMPFMPGIGVGGHCIPVDPYFLLSVTNDIGVDMTVVSNAMNYISNGALNTLDWLKLRVIDLPLLVTGVAYKDGVSDIRGSPAVELIELLMEEFDVFFWDKNVDSITIAGKKMNSLTDLEFASFAGAVVIVNYAGRLFCEKESLKAKMVLDARYRVELNL